MRLYLLRHGDAPFDDSCGERVLSAKGALQTAKVAGGRAEELQQLSHIICSPSRRARETFSVLSDQLQLSVELLFDDCLRTESSVSRVETFIDRLTGEQSVNAILLITHQPLIGSLFRYLLDRADDHTFLGTSNLVAVQLIAFGRGCGELCWIDTP